MTLLTPLFMIGVFVVPMLLASSSEDKTTIAIIDNNKLISDYRGNISFSHRYDKYAKNSNFNIIKNQVIRPYSMNDKQWGQTGHFDLHLKS